MIERWTEEEVRAAWNAQDMVLRDDESEAYQLAEIRRALAAADELREKRVRYETCVNGKRAPWESNCWVWRVEFRRVER